METLSHLIKAMEQAVILDRDLEMSSYFDDGTPTIEDTIHTCGTAACVLGYGALLSDSPYNKNDIAEKLWDSLDDDIGGPLADSVADSSQESRMKEAKFYFVTVLGEDGEWLEKQNHLTSENPTAQDALDYMLEVKKRLQE